MKKILTRILCLCMIFALAGCSSSKNKDDIITVFDALDTTLNAKSGKITGSIDYTTTTSQKINYALEIIQDGNLQVKADLGLEAGGNTLDDYMHFYIKDGKTYLNYMGTKSQSIASNIGIDVTSNLSVYNPFLDLTDTELNSLFESSSKDGNTYTLVLDGEQLTTLLDSMGTLSISTAKVIATLKKDYISDLEIVIKGYQAYDETSYDVDIDITCTLEDYNSLSSIEFPSDLESYQS